MSLRVESAAVCVDRECVLKNGMHVSSRRIYILYSLYVQDHYRVFRSVN